jgi:hypothetical protein
MANKPADPPKDPPIVYPWPPHEFLVPSLAFDHLSPQTVKELKALQAAGKITVTN